MTKQELIKILRLSEQEVERYPTALVTLTKSFSFSNEVHEPTVYLIWDSVPYRAIKKLEDELREIKYFTV